MELDGTEKQRRAEEWRKNRILSADCETCGMRKYCDKTPFNCQLCGMRIRGKPKILNEEEKSMKFCCDKCLFSYINSNW